MWHLIDVQEDNTDRDFKPANVYCELDYVGIIIPEHHLNSRDQHPRAKSVSPNIQKRQHITRRGVERLSGGFPPCE